MTATVGATPLVLVSCVLFFSLQKNRQAASRGVHPNLAPLFNLRVADLGSWCFLVGGLGWEAHGKHRFMWVFILYAHCIYGWDVYIYMHVYICKYIYIYRCGYFFKMFWKTLFCYFERCVFCCSIVVCCIAKGGEESKADRSEPLLYCSPSNHHHLSFLPMTCIIFSVG